MKNKKLLSIISLLVIFSLVLSGCSSQTPESGSASGSSSEGSDEEQVKTITIDLASVYDGKSPQMAGGATKFKELVEERSNGAIEVNLFPNGALGSEKDTFNALAGDELQMIIGGIQAVDQFAPEYMFITAPYLIKGWDHLKNILEGDLGQKMVKTLDEKNVHMLAVNYRSIRHTSSSKKFTTPEEMRGLKLRLPEVNSWVATWKGLGANPTPIALPELYGALQTNVVEASEGGYDQLATFKLYEVQDYLVKTQHVFEPAWIFISKSFLDSLPADQQDIIVNSAKEAMLYTDELAEEMGKEYLKQLTDNGMEVIEPNLDAFLEEAKPVLDDMFKSTWTATTYDEVMEYAK